MQGNWTNTTQYQDRYTYNHKEQVTGIEWFAYGARYYDAKIGRFAGVDPIAEKFAWVTTFNYAENRPVDGVDIWGLQYSNFNGTKFGPLSEEYLQDPDEEYHETYDVNENGVYDVYLPAITVTPEMHETPWMDIAIDQIGVTEETGNNDGPDVESYLQSTGLPSGNPWCGAFVNWCLEAACIDGVDPSDENHPARALSWRSFGNDLDTPAYGSIATKTRRGGGHVGFVYGVNASGDSLYILGGNQNNSVNVSLYPIGLFRFNYPFGYVPNYSLPVLDEEGEEVEVSEE